MCRLFNLIVIEFFIITYMFILQLKLSTYAYFSYNLRTKTQLIKQLSVSNYYIDIDSLRMHFPVQKYELFTRLSAALINVSKD